MKASFVLIFLMVFMVFTKNFQETEAFCGGCGCNMFGCACDWTTDNCGGDIRTNDRRNSNDSDVSSNDSHILQTRHSYKRSVGIPYLTKLF